MDPPDRARTLPLMKLKPTLALFSAANTEIRLKGREGTKATL